MARASAQPSPRDFQVSLPLDRATRRLPTFLRGSCRQTNNNNLIRILSLFFQSPLERLGVGELAHAQVFSLTWAWPRAKSRRDRVPLHTGTGRIVFIQEGEKKLRDGLCEMEVQGKKGRTQSLKLPQPGIDWPIMWSSIYENVAVASNFMETFISRSPSHPAPPFLLSSLFCVAL